MVLTCRLPAMTKLVLSLPKFPPAAGITASGGVLRAQKIGICTYIRGEGKMGVFVLYFKII